MFKISELEELKTLFALLPGLLTYLIVHALTARHERYDAAKIVLSALAYTLLVYATWSVLTAIGSLIPTPDLAGLTLCSVGWGLIISWLHSRGFIFASLRRIGLTEEGAWPSIWRTAFHEFRKKGGDYVVLHLRDGRRLFGMLVGIPPEQNAGHLFLAPAMWLLTGLPDENLAGIEMRWISGGILIGAEQVLFVEFVLPEGSSSDDQRETIPTPASSES